MIYELQSQYKFSNYDFFLQVNIILNINDPVSYRKDYGIFEQSLTTKRVSNSNQWLFYLQEP